MLWNLKKIGPIIAVYALLTTNYTHADFDKSALHNLENRLISLEQGRGSNGTINPPGMPLTRNSWGFQVSADLLLWQLQANGLEYVLQTGTASHYPTRIEGIEGTDPSIKQKRYNWGFRIGLDWTLPHDNWDIATTWTRITHDYSNSTVSAEETVLTRVQGTFSFNGLKSASARYDNHLDQICLNVGREFFISKWITLRPHFGLRTDWLNQRFHSIFPADFPEETSLQKNRWWGIGIESGLNARWNFCGGFNIYGCIAAAIEYGFQKLVLNEDGELDTLFRMSYRICRPMLDTQLGLGWDYNFYDDKLHFGLKAGWENHVYFNQSHFLSYGQTDHYSEVSRGGDLTYQGLTVSASLDF